MKIQTSIYLNEHSTSKLTKSVIYESINICSLCHSTFSSLPSKRLLISEDNNTISLYCFYVCLTCHKAFIAKYSKFAFVDDSMYEFTETPFISPVDVEKKVFDDYLVNLSEDFAATYNEAYEAEQHGLMKICGMGYRRALEYLIKDYLIHKYPKDSEHIKSASLTNCIDSTKYSISTNIKEVAKRCAWLGNDHSHYIVKHTDKDLNDLKELLNITSLWILMELKTEELLKIQHK